jgi:hypothetical protein
MESVPAHESIADEREVRAAVLERNYFARDVAGREARLKLGDSRRRLLN